MTRGSAGRLIQLVDRFAKRRVAVLADLVMDEFVQGEIERVSREAPVLILRHDRTVTAPGGGANAVANLHALGAEPVPIGVVGRDEAGRRLRDEFRRLGIRTGSIVSADGYETPAKTRIIAGGIHTRRQQVVRLDRGASPGALPASLQKRLLEKLVAALRAAEGLVVADYGYGAATPELLEAAPTRRSGLQVTVDSRGRVARFSGVTACTPNQEELEQAVGLDPISAEKPLDAAGRKLLRRSGSRAVLVTRGSKGMRLFERGRRTIDVPPFGSEEVADVTGAGDTVVAAFSLGLLAGGTFHEAALLANYAAGLVVMKAGTATVSPEELLSAIREDRA